jgi:hypothetical protein
MLLAKIAGTRYLPPWRAPFKGTLAWLGWQRYVQVFRIEVERDAIMNALLTSCHLSKQTTHREPIERALTSGSHHFTPTVSFTAPAHCMTTALHHEQSAKLNRLTPTCSRDVRTPADDRHGASHRPRALHGATWVGIA